MIQIRKGVFETNSSSTHSIVISKQQPQIPAGTKIVFQTGEFGWENDCYTNTGDYLYTAILDGPDDLRTERLEKLKKMLHEMNVSYKFKKPKEISGYYGSWFEECSIDHSYECGTMIDALLADKDMLARFLFGDSCIYTGNDNEDDDPATFSVAYGTYWDYDTNEEKPNPYHDEEHYDYFYKGN